MTPDSESDDAEARGPAPAEPTGESPTGIADRLRRLAREVARYAVLDDRTADELIGFGSTDVEVLRPAP